MPLVTGITGWREPIPCRAWTDQELALLSEVTERSWAHIERVRSEAEARERDNQFRTLAQALPNHVWTARPDGFLDWFNDQVHEYTGAIAGTLDGDGWTSILHPDDVAAAALAWKEALESGANYETEFRLRRSDGAWRWHLSRAVALRDHLGKVLRWVGTNTDVDDQKHSEALLEERLAERTAALAESNERLQQSQKMEAIGNLTGGVAHDFDNLLSAILGSLELLRKRLPSDPNLLRLVDTATEGANRGASLTRRMLAFARRQDLRSERIDVAQLIEGMRELLERALGPMIIVDVVIPADLPSIEADANQLEAAVLRYQATSPSRSRSTRNPARSSDVVNVSAILSSSSATSTRMISFPHACRSVHSNTPSRPSLRESEPSRHRAKSRALPAAWR